MRSAKIISAVRKRSLNLGGHKTSVSLENEFWSALKEIAAEKQTTLFELCSQIDQDRGGNLSSALRLYVLAHYVERSKQALVGKPIAPKDL